MLLATGCEVDSQPVDSGQLAAPSGARVVRWVGAVEQSDVHVAMLVAPGKARLFFCGGTETYASTTRWFNIAFDGGEHVDFEEDTWRVHAHLAGGNVAGEVELGDGVTRWFEAKPVAPGTLAGLYEGKATCGRVGLIVTQASRDALPTAQGACAGSTTQPITVVAPLREEAGQIAVQAPAAADATLLLSAAAIDPL